MDKLLEEMEKYMSKKNLRRYELAHKLGTTESNISNWMNRKHKISKSWIELIKQRLELK